MNNMSRKLIEISHHVDDYECMWNGIEDLYMMKMGEKLPSFFFFAVAGTGNFMYMKHQKGELKRQAVWNDGRTKQMYEKVSNLIGFSYKYVEGKPFSKMLTKAKKEIDEGYPVIVGCLDMYYLSYYPKFFYKEHIPTHYVMMVGYDDEKQCILIRDCGIEGVQELSYEVLEKALDVENGGLSKKNTICLIRFNEKPTAMMDIARAGFKQKAEQMLSPAVKFLGIPGMRKLAKEFNNWEKELTKEEYRASLNWLVTFNGTVPSMPSRLIGKACQDDILHQGAREKLAAILEQLGKEYQILKWLEAAETFRRSGLVMEKMTDKIVAYLVGEIASLNEVPTYIEQIADLEEEAFTLLLAGCKTE